MIEGLGTMRSRPVGARADVKPSSYNRVAVIEVKPDETSEQAWRRHLAKHPEDAQVFIKIFHRAAVVVGFSEGRPPTI